MVAATALRALLKAPGKGKVMVPGVGLRARSTVRGYIKDPNRLQAAAKRARGAKSGAARSASGRAAPKAGAPKTGAKAARTGKAGTPKKLTRAQRQANAEQVNQAWEKLRKIKSQQSRTRSRIVEVNAAIREARTTNILSSGVGAVTAGLTFAAPNPVTAALSVFGLKTAASTGIRASRLLKIVKRLETRRSSLTKRRVEVERLLESLV